MIVRHRVSAAIGQVLSRHQMPVERVGDMAGLWYEVNWSDGFQSCVKATSVTVIQPNQGAPQ